MKRISRVISLLVVFCLTFCSFFIIGVQKPEAASGKTVYVMTRLVVKDYDSNDENDSDLTYICSYDKKGLLKSSTMKTDDGKIKLKSTFKYGKGSKLKSCKTKSYYKGKNLNIDTSKKFTVNSKGFVTKIRSYNEKGKINASAKYTWNKNGILTRSRFYSEKGKLTEHTDIKRLFRELFHEEVNLILHQDPDFWRERRHKNVMSKKEEHGRPVMLFLDVMRTFQSESAVGVITFYCLRLHYCLRVQRHIRCRQRR